MIAEEDKVITRVYAYGTQRGELFVIPPTAQEEYTLDTLELLSKEKMSDNLLSVLWNAHFIDAMSAQP